MTGEVDYLIERLMQAQSIWREVFREEQSVIPTDILLIVVRDYKRGQPISMKELVAELPHSEAGIKQHLRRLENEGLVIRQPCEQDGRVVRLAPSDRLLETIVRMGRDIQKVFSPQDMERPRNQRES